MGASMQFSKYQRLLAALVAALVVGLPSAASAIPEIVPLQGYLTDDLGTPVDAADLPVTFRFYSTAASATVLWEEAVLLDVDDGVFVYELGLSELLELSLFAGADVWLGIDINDEGELDPRVQMGTVPYAAVAANVPWAGVTGVPAELADGDDDTTYVGAPPIVVTGSTISLATVGCDAGDTWVYNGASWGCSPVTAFTAGSGISFDGTTLAVDSSIQRRISTQCPAGQYMYGVTAGGTPICRADQDTPSTYTGGFGVNVSGNTIVADTTEMQRILGSHDCQYGIRSISSAGVVTCAANNDTQRTYTQGFGITISGNQIAANLTQVQQRIAGTSCTYGIRQIAGNGAVSCAAAPPTNVYSAGFGLALSGSNQFSVTSAIQRNIAGTSCPYGIRLINDDGSVVCAAAQTGGFAFANCPDSLHFMYGNAANGAPRCNYLPHRVRDYTRNNCVYTVGWSDVNRGCCDYLMHTNTNYGQRGGYGRIRGWYWDGYLGHFASVGTSGDVDGNDWFWYGFRCH